MDSGWVWIAVFTVATPATVGDWSNWNRRMKLAKLHKDLEDCKKRLEAAVKAKKKSSDIRKEYEGLRTQVLREETKG